MSRYILPSKTYQQYVAVGFARPTSTYFFQVFEDGNDEPLINVDTRRNYDILELLDQYLPRKCVDSLSFHIRNAISGDFDPEDYFEMMHIEQEKQDAVRTMFELCGVKR